MLTTNQKGAIAEAEIAAAAIKAGFVVLRTLVDARYDLVFDTGSRLIRVQCKTAVRRGDAVVVTCRTCRRTSTGFARGGYTSAEIDAVAAYCSEIDRCFCLPVAAVEGRTAVQLRLTPARNNQRLRINWADDFDFARLDWDALEGL